MIAPPPILYSFRRCPYAIRARMAVLATNRCVELREVDLKHKPASLLKWSPKGTVPVLIIPANTKTGTPERVIDQSLDIMRWAKTGMMSQWPVKLPTSLTDKIDQRFKPALDIYKYRDRHEDAEVNTAIDTCVTILKALDDRLQHHTWLEGHRFSFTDIAIFPFVRQLHFSGAHLLASDESHPPLTTSHLTHLASWLQRLLSSELFARSMERFPTWNETAPGPLFFRQMPSSASIAKASPKSIVQGASSQRKDQCGSKVHVTAFYRFTPVSDPQALKAKLIEHISDGAVLGTILIAPEGINGSIASDNMDHLTGVLERLADLLDTDEIVPHHHICNSMPFRALKLRIKAEIVTFRADDHVSFSEDASDSYIAPERWNTVISDPETIVIDTRNDYEISLGSFNGAIDPKTRSFGEFKDYVETELKDKKQAKIAMFCTGGIRCEKASRWMKAEGFSNVRQLAGGILGYLASVPKEESTWHGDCFVFDDRIAVDHDLSPTPMPICTRCGDPYHPADGCPCAP